MKQRRIAAGAIGVLVVAAGAFVQSASATVAPVGVKTTSLYEAGPSAGVDSGSGDSYFAWFQNSEAKPKHFDSYLEINGGSTTRLNASRTVGWDAGIDGTNLVFQEVSTDTNNSDLVLYDIASATRLPAPAGLNGGAWQWDPTISGNWILYGENSRSRNFSRVMLHNTSTGEERTLAESTWKAFTVFQGQVSGDYAAYYRVGRAWNVVVYKISTGEKTKVPNPNDKFNYTPAVTADGTAYYARSGNDCGENVRIYRWSVVSPLDPPVLLTSLPAGKDISARLHAFNDGVSTKLYFDRFGCPRGKSNIYRLDGADTATAADPAFVGRGGTPSARGTIPPGARAEDA